MDVFRGSMHLLIIGLMVPFCTRYILILCMSGVVVIQVGDAYVSKDRMCVLYNMTFSSVLSGQFSCGV